MKQRKEDIDMKKKLITGITTAAILAACAGSAFAAPSVVINNQTLKLDQPPVVIDSRTLVPMRTIFEALGCEIQWYADTQTVVAQKDLDFFSLQVGKDILYAGEKELKLDVPAQIVNNHTMVPLRAVSEALDANVSWDADTETVNIVLAEQGSYNYTMEKYTQNTANGTVDMAYPQFTDKTNSILSGLNSQLSAAAHTRATAFQQDITNNMEPGATYTYSVMDRYALKYNKQPYFSILFQTVQDTGGAHPMTTRNAITYDMTTGKALALTDILNGDQSAIDQRILDGFTAMLEANPDQFYAEADKSLREAIAAKSYGFYLTEQGLTIYFQLYDIAPYAAGFQEYTIPFSQTDAFKLKF